MKTTMLLLFLAACGQPVQEWEPKDGDPCEHRQASWTFCNEAGEQIVCETTADPAINTWFFNGVCTGHEGFYCQSQPGHVYCEGI